MLTIDQELETTLTNLAKQEHLSLNDMMKRLIDCYISQHQARLTDDKLAQLAIGREFMHDYHQTFSELAK